MRIVFNRLLGSLLVIVACPSTETLGRHTGSSKRARGCLERLEGELRCARVAGCRACRVPGLRRGTVAVLSNSGRFFAVCKQEIRLMGELTVVAPSLEATHSRGALLGGHHYAGRSYTAPA